jgi:hypothetical protein
MNVLGGKFMPKFNLPSIMIAFALGSLAQFAGGATLVADYDFQQADALASTVAGAPDLTVVGGGTYSPITDTVDGSPRTVAQLSGTVGLRGETDAIIPDNGSYSIVLLAKYNATNSPLDTTFAVAGKVIDFKDRTSDAGVYNGQGVFQFFGGNTATLTAIGTSPAGTLAAGNYLQFAITRDSSDAVNAYIDGSPAFNFSDTNNDATIGAALAQQFLNFLIDDTVTPGTPVVNEDQGGDIARIRLYSGALSATDVANLDRVPEPGSLSILLLGTAIVFRRVRN